MNFLVKSMKFFALPQTQFAISLIQSGQKGRSKKITEFMDYHGGLLGGADNLGGGCMILVLITSICFVCLLTFFLSLKQTTGFMSKVING